MLMRLSCAIFPVQCCVIGTFFHINPEFEPRPEKTCFKGMRTKKDTDQHYFASAQAIQCLGCMLTLLKTRGPMVL